ncbi:polysaccharide deacetylase family protein [Yinghuangia soli]|uniref:Polysaccharide deacetylase family protein n=1 Tax=Yinghuangia soli TaxID=2908204 RepID=A0AA41TZR1_9ACTN|nr:polysaccharide deacetylase family protein [Yinghuangia soli]MCF2527565.1 polysaccharide deacetylase family protein [Yinghuangia soli]
MPVRSASFQAAVVALAVFLCGFLVWTASADTVRSGTPVAGSRPTQDDAGQPPQPGGPSDGPASLPSGAATPPAGGPPAHDTGKVSTALQSRTGHTDGGKWVALTFDDGPWTTYTGQVLEILKQHDIKAVFCVVGNQAKALPGQIRDIVAAGHTLCNHTMSHDTKMPDRTPDEMRAQMQGTLDAIRAAVPNAPVPWYRAPGGMWSPQVQEMAASLGMRSLGWTVDTLDWRKPGIDKMNETMSKQLGPNGVILMHDGGGDRTMSVDYLRQLIPNLLAQGYKFTVPV